MNIINLLLLATILINFLIIGIIFIKKQKLGSVVFFIVYLIGNIWWSIGLTYLLSNPLTDPYVAGDTIYLVGQFTYLAPIILMAGKLWFLKYYLNHNKILNSFFDYIAIFLSILLFILVLIPNTFFTEIFIYYDGYLSTTKGSLVLVFTIFVLFHYLYPFFVVRNRLKKETDILLKKQLIILVWSHGIITGLGMITNWILPHYLDIPQLTSFGPIFTLGVAITFAYAVTRYHFLDLRLNLQKLLSYGTTSLILTPPTYAIFNYCSTIPNHPFYLCIFPALTVFLLLFFPLKNFLNKLFNLLLYSEKQNYQEKIQLLIRKLSHGKLALQQALQQIPTTLNQALNLKGCFFVPAHELALFGANFKDDQVLYREELACLGELENNQVLKRTAQKMAEQKISVLAPIQQNSTCQGALAIQEKNSADKLFSTEELAAIQQLTQKTVLYLNNFAQQKRDQEYFYQFQHFFRTPFTVGLLYMQQAMNEIKKDSPAYKNLQNSCQNFQKVIRFSSNFISLMSIEWNKKYLRTTTSLKRSLEKALEEIPATLNERNQTFKPKITIRGRTNLIVLGSDDTLYEVLRELILNALIFDAGAADILVKTSYKFKTATIIIANTGTLTRKEIATVLTPFGCVKGNHHSISVNFTQVFAEAIGGHFTLTSGRGKTFAKLTLPLAKEIPENK